MSSINTKNTQRLVQEQRPILTQELQLFLKLIHMTTLELREYLEDQLVENPLLEEIEERNSENETSPGIREQETQSGDQSEDKLEGQTEVPGSDNNNNNDTEFDFKSIEDGFRRDANENFSFFNEFSEDYDEEVSWENRVSSTDSLIDHLNWQLSISDLSLEDREVASLIIGNTNEDGYLEADIEEIALQMLRKKYEPDLNSEPDNPREEHRNGFYENLIKTDGSYVDKVESVLEEIHYAFDPVGVCARDLKECLKIQAENLGHKKDSVVIKIIENYLEEIGRKDYEQVAAALGIAIEKIENAASMISLFEPKPGRPFYLKDSEKYVVPDFYVHKVGDDLQIQLNRDFPKVRISSYYRNLFKDGRSLPRDAKRYIKEKLEAAQRIVKCLEERDTTIRKVVSEIVNVQKEFFEYGKPYIKPLRLKDIALTVSVHESTVSRITSRRYIQTPQGTVQLKSLFSRKIETSHGYGRDLSFEKVKTIIREIVADEPRESPYSDDDISKILERRNIKVARRTVAKYRKILGIPSSGERASENLKKS